LPAFVAKLRITFRAELLFTSLAALMAEFGIAFRAELIEEGKRQEEGNS
jgi:hypothetical protein